MKRSRHLGRSRLAVLSSLAVLIAALSAGRALAQEAGRNDADARMHFRLGDAYYESGAFADAAREFELAYQMSERPALLYNMYVAHRDAGNLPRAIHALREFLRLNPEAENREQLAARLTIMERSVEEGAGSDASPESASTETEATASVAVRPAEGGGSTWVPGWIVTGVGAAVLIAGVVTGAFALGEQSTLDTMCDETRTCNPGFESTRDSAVLLAGLTDGFLIGGGVIAVTGVVLALLVPSGGETSPQASLMCTGSGCMAVGQLRF